MNFAEIKERPEWSPSEIHSSIGTSVIDVSPDLAALLLTLNFKNNRILSKTQVVKFAQDMKQGRWHLSNDAITISIDGELLNAQHRLSAVIMSKTTQPFLIAWGYAKSSAQIYDTGKKRSMDERITVGGTKITTKECAIVRHAMNKWSINEHGTIEFAQPRHDELVKQIYLKHKEFLYLTNAHKPAGPAFYHAAALKMYAEMIHFGKHHDYHHDQTPIERAQLFIDVCNHGYSLKGIPVGITESAAFKLRVLRERRQQDKKSVTKYWADKFALQLTVTAAYKFMTGEHVEFLRRPESDPFNNFLKVPSTNRLHESQSNWLI
ncbi:ParB-like nuclease domain containing protein [uncultured Mediterranean phage uvMED]|nr:ParB-like nuclease domain containing protein [uncultured Mediterranean phage uvMED]